MVEVFDVSSTSFWGGGGVLIDYMKKWDNPVRQCPVGVSKLIDVFKVGGGGGYMQVAPKSSFFKLFVYIDKQLKNERSERASEFW